MLKQPAPFPFAGSEALYGDRKVRIIRVEADGRRLISGTGRPQLCRTVDIDELADAAPPEDPVAAWLADRTLDGGLTTFVDLYQDFTVYAGLRGLTGHDVPARIVFGRRLHELRGVTGVRRRLANAVGASLCLPIALKPLANAA